MKVLISFWKTVVCSMIMLVLFLLPADKINKAPSIPLISVAAHVFLFALFAWILAHDLAKNRQRTMPVSSDYIIALLTGVLFGIIIEGLQRIINLGRNAEFLDVLYDIAGIILSIGVIIIYSRLRHIISPKG